MRVWSPEADDIINDINSVNSGLKTNFLNLKVRERKVAVRNILH